MHLSGAKLMHNLCTAIYEWGFFVAAKITGSSILVPCHVVMSQQLIWRLGTRRWNLRVSILQMSYSDLTQRQGTRTVVSEMTIRVTFPIPLVPNHWPWFCHLFPAGLLVNAEGLAILTVAKIGFLLTARGGSGIVIAKLNSGGEKNLWLIYPWLGIPVKSPGN